MRFPSSFAALLGLGALLDAAVASPRSDLAVERRTKKEGCVKPKVVIISLFPPEAGVWYGIPEFDLLVQNITVPGLSPLYPEVHCTASGDVCQLTGGESEINAATSITALWTSDKFDLTSTYFLIAGIAGVNPEVATLGSVAFARFAVQVALQYEFDVRELSANWSTGYVPFGSKVPSQYPSTLYGTEVFELNTALRSIAAGFAKTATLNDSAAAVAYRANYGSASAYAAGAASPSVVECDVATSDVYYSGTLLSEAFGNFTKLITNGTGVYCTTAQEDNAILESLLRAANHSYVDYSRIISMRTASDFDRPYPGEDPTYNLFYANQGGFLPAIRNIYLAGIKVVMGILDGWDATFAAGVPADNYIGDIFATLGGTPDFGPGYIPAAAKRKRDLDVAASMLPRRLAKRGLLHPSMPFQGVTVTLNQD